MRRLRKSLVRLLLLLAVVLVAIYAGRRLIAESAARLILESEGLADADFDVLEIGWGETVVADVALPSSRLAARRLRFLYDPFELASGTLREIEADGLTVDAAEGWPEALAPLARGGDEGPARLAIGLIRLVDGRILLPPPAGGEITADGVVDLAATGAGSELRIGIAARDAHGQMTLASDSLAGAARISVRGSVETDLARPPFERIAALGLDAGPARLAVQGSLTLPPDHSWHSALTEGLDLAGRLTVSRGTAAGGRGVSADIGWTLRSAEGAVALALPGGARLEIDHLPADWLAALYLPAREGGALSLTLSGQRPVVLWRPDGTGGTLAIDAEATAALGSAVAELALRGEVRHGPDGGLAGPASVAVDLRTGGAELSGAAGSAWLDRLDWRAQGIVSAEGVVEAGGPLALAAADLRIGDFRAGDAALAGDIRGRWASSGWSFSAAPGMTLTLEDAALPGRFESPGMARASLDRLVAGGGGSGVRLEIAATAAGLTGKAGDVAFAQAGGRVTLELGTGTPGLLRLDRAEARLPDQQLSVTAAAARLPFVASEAAPTELSAEISDTGRAARFTPLRIALSGTRLADRLELTGSLATVNGRVSLPLAATADLAAQAGEIRIGPGRIDFHRKGLQPAALSPLLGQIADAEGEVRIAGTVSRGGDGKLATALELTLSDFSARTPEMDVEGLAGKLRFSSLAPLASSGVQELTARRLTAGVPVEGVRVAVTVVPHPGGPAFLVREASASLSGGEIAIADATWETGAAANKVDLRVRGVSLERLLSDWQIEGVSGSGTLSGVIPVRVSDGSVAIAGGQIGAEEPGVIRVDWGAARDTLVAAGQQVELAVTALEDFRYRVLSIGVEQPAGGELALAVGLEGANPAVLDGHPFRFNITLSGQLDPILAALREGRRIGSGLLRGDFGTAR